MSNVCLSNNQYVDIRWNFVHAQNFRTGSTYDNVHQRMSTYCSVSVTNAKRIPSVCNVHQRSSQNSHASAYVGAIRCSVTAL